jgi:hypothetical protein
VLSLVAMQVGDPSSTQRDGVRYSCFWCTHLSVPLLSPRSQDGRYDKSCSAVSHYRFAACSSRGHVWCGHWGPVEPSSTMSCTRMSCARNTAYLNTLQMPAMVHPLTNPGHQSAPQTRPSTEMNARWYVSAALGPWSRLSPPSFHTALSSRSGRRSSTSAPHAARPWHMRRKHRLQSSPK